VTVKKRSKREVAEFEGPVQRTGGGAGFFLLPSRAAEKPSAELFIAADDMRGALSGDTVRVKMLGRRRRGGQRCGEVLRVLERSTTRFVGRYFERAGLGWVRVDGTLFADPVVVGDPGAKGVRPGDQVVLEMLHFPEWNQQAEGVLLEVLGPRDQSGVDELTIIHEFGLPVEFPDDVLVEARQAVAAFDEDNLDGRLDLTSETIVTIDPGDARDFDDAISLETLDDGGWRLGVHIADVSHFVVPGGALDREARRRGTSVYLPGRVLPMLPELISNGLASLQQNRVRYVISALIEFSEDGIPRDVAFARAAIRVTRRFSYEQVGEILADPDGFRGRVAAPVRRLLVEMHQLSRVLRRRRFAAGALELHLPELKIDLGAGGRVEAVRETVHDESHQVIEEFMLAANSAVASTLTDRGLVFLRRIHPSPNITKLRQFATFVGGLGFRLDRPQSRPALQKLLDKVEGGPLSQAVNYALLRSFKQAEYTGREEEHYALALENYCHFTSPIRRYPDLTIHRLIASLASGRRTRGLSASKVDRLGRSCSLTARRAEKAERALVRLKLLMFVRERIGQTIDAIITGVEKFGVICRGMSIPIESLVHVRELDDNDFFDFDRGELTLTGRRSGRSFRLGDQVRVKIVGVNLDRRTVELAVDQRSGRVQRPGTCRRGETSGDEKKSSKSRRGKGRRKGRRRGRGRR
jgi:ribonuclease R